MSSMQHRGFTIVELVVVVTIMAILLTLSVVNVRGSQEQARDSERKADIEAIAKHLETYYSSKTAVPLSGEFHYLGTTAINDTDTTTYLTDIDPKSLRTPDNNENTSISLLPATNAVETVAGVRPLPTKDTYVYQAINTDKTLCTSPLSTSTQDCRRFNLYYLLETDNTVYLYKSKNR